jgi:SWI/SNF-related matrix-associated actin-dependent regulator 1 of chromatin subfamily A
VKNASAKRSQALLPLLESAKRVLCLSGTPAMSRPYELWAQINALRPTLFGSAHQFGTRYCEPKKGFRGKIEYKGATNLVELHMLLKKYVLIRRLKADVLTDLRPKTRTVIVTSVHDRALADSIRAIANLKHIVAAQIQASGSVAGAAAAAAAANDSQNGPKRAITQLFADTGKAKLHFIVSYISDLLAAGSKFLVFAHHLMVLDGIEACLKKEKAGYFRLDGSTPPAMRQAGVERFQTDRTKHKHIHTSAFMALLIACSA